MTRHRSPRVLAVAAATALLAPPLLNAQASPSHHVAVPPAAARPEDVATVDGIVRAYYDVITGPAGQPRPWSRDRPLYIPDPRLGDLVRRGSGASDPAGIPALISAAIRTALFALLFMGSVLVYIPYLLAAGGATGGWHLGAWRYLGLLPLGAGIAGIARCLRDFA